MLKRSTKPKAWNVLESSKATIAVASLVSVLLVLTFRSYNGEKQRSSGKSVQFNPTVKQKWNTFESVQFKPTVEFRNGTDLVWQIPDTVKAVLFIAHGCDGRAVNFWDKSSSCPNCIGLPEERLLVLNALARNYAVLTISSAGRCWTFGEERFIIQDIIKWWVQRHNFEKLPLVALGASSGGYFVSALATNLKFRSITIMIAEGIFDQMDITENYPPTLFVHMPKDLRRQRKVSEFVKDLKSKGIGVAEVKCLEFPLSPSFLADRIPGLDKSLSSELFELFQKKGFVDAKGYMKKDGRATRWKEALPETVKRQLVQAKNLFHHVQEELNLAYASHEMTSLQSEEIFKWFESHMK